MLGRIPQTRFGCEACSQEHDTYLAVKAHSCPLRNPKSVVSTKRKMDAAAPPHQHDYIKMKMSQARENGEAKSAKSPAFRKPYSVGCSAQICAASQNLQ
jgi:hypothetical protein